jgi:hypothetical protein
MVITYAHYSSGRIQNWRRSPGGGDLRNFPFFVVKADSSDFNRLFAKLQPALDDTLRSYFGKLTNMAYVIPGRDCKLIQIFMEKVPSTARRIEIS